MLYTRYAPHLKSILTQQKKMKKKNEKNKTVKNARAIPRIIAYLPHVVGPNHLSTRYFTI